MALEEDYGFDEIFFEDIQYQNNAATYRKLSYVQAALIIWCYNADYKFTILAPSHWRGVLKDIYGVSFGRSRPEQKKKAMALVKDHFNLDVPEDTADAICIGLCGIQEREKDRSAF